MTRIWYEKLPQHPYSFWPILEVKIKNKAITLPQVFSLIDSGASMSILHLELAQALGFDLQKLGKPQSGGKSVSGQYHSWILPETIDVNICGSTFPIRFTVINNKSLIWPCILGEDTIFQFARLDFYKYKGYFDLEFRKDLN